VALVQRTHECGRFVDQQRSTGLSKRSQITRQVLDARGTISVDAWQRWASAEGWLVPGALRAISRQGVACYGRQLALRFPLW
jgi:hypothetical protein